jgi:Domain of unknown function (DUF4249)
MKNNIIISAFLILFLASCEREVILDLKESNGKYVVEGIITNDSNIQTIKINESVSFYESNNYPPVSNALVKVIENGNVTRTFTETSLGTYKAGNFIGIPGHSYTLSITIAGVNYSATSTMPEIVPLAAISFKENTFNPPGQSTNYEVTPIFTDPIGIKNFYRFNLFLDDVKDNAFVTLNDDLINGQANNFSLRSSDNDNSIVLGTNVTIEMIGIDKNTYNYFYVLEQNSDSQNTPNNPKSNISGDVLGYFSAQNRQIQSIRIQ